MTVEQKIIKNKLGVLELSRMAPGYRPSPDQTGYPLFGIAADRELGRFASPTRPAHNELARPIAVVGPG